MIRRPKNAEIDEDSEPFCNVAHFDRLTRLPNSTLMVERLQQAIAQSKRRGQMLAVACIDLCGLKSINANHGHGYGDEVLMYLSSAMKQVLRKGDTLGRLGGDEFAAILMDLPDTESCVPVIQRLLQAATEPVEVDNFFLQLTASVGVTFYPQAEAPDADQLFRQAARAMRQAKQKGRNRYSFFDSSGEAELLGASESLARIRQALMENEFILEYQPFVNMSKGTVEGVEALIRWMHPERGKLSPQVFMPTIENHPLMVGVGEWVLQAAVAQLEQWLEAGLDLKVSVNISIHELQQPEFVDRLAMILAKHPRAKPTNLQFEILETSVMEDATHLSRLQEECRQIGVTFVLDDFGTGNSSLSDLKRSSARVLKIDPVFVRDILINPDDLTILEGILGLASAFRREVIAEGVDTIDHGMLLLRLGCEVAQGHVIARPMPADQIPAWAAGWKPDPRWTDALYVSIDDRPLLYASAEHRAWIAAIDAYIKGETFVEPRLSRHLCQLGAWLDEEAKAGRNTHPLFQAIVAMHWRLHALASGLLKMRNQGKSEESQARLAELDGLMAELLERIEMFRLNG